MFICDHSPVRGPWALGWAAILTLAAITPARGADPIPPRSPAEALRSFQLEEGLQIELVAAEPLVVNPVAFVFDGPTRLLVAEGRGYPDPVAGGGRTTEGRIALLEDKDGDGRFEHRTEFATGLGYVNGLALWRGGVFVTAAPDILYLKDNDGDGVADEKRVVLTGFDMTKTAQLRVSHPTLGLDGRFYVTSGLNGGKVTAPSHPERPEVVFSLKDGRFDPDTFEFDNTGGRGQFGLTFDAFGRRFICSNRHPVLQVMLEPWHLSRNPHLGFGETTQEVSRVEAEAKVFPISRATLSADFIPKLMGAPHTGTFTSASGVLVFGGTGLTPQHESNLFICESAQNLIQRQIARPAGASFRSEPAASGREFLASTDVWFRPVFVASGPDGALYVADMYRREIDHPRYVPEESRGLLDFEGGKDRGRIYRIVRAGNRPTLAPRPGDTLDLLMGDLHSPDEWWRARAFRLLLERNDAGAAPLLEKSVLGSARPETRTRALWLLQAKKALPARVLAAALRDRHPGVREQALRLFELRQDSDVAVRTAVLATARDDDARVRFVAALALAGMTEPNAVAALTTIALRDGEDRWARAAVLSGVDGRLEAFLTALRAAPPANEKAFAAVMEHLGRIFGASASPEACRNFVTPMLTGDGDWSWRLASVLGLIEGQRGRPGNKATAGTDPFAVLLGGEGKNRPDVQAFLTQVARRATLPAASAKERASAVALLGYTSFDFAGAALVQLLDARQPPDVQLQAVRAFERLGDPRGGAVLIAKENWSRYTPQVREAVLAALTARVPLILVLCDAIDTRVIAPAEISSVRRTALLKHADLKVRERAEKVFKDLEGGDRMQVYRTYREWLGQGTDIARGRETFVKTCSACHTHKGVGGKVGPDLTGIRNQPADAILLHILVPNYEVAPNYQTISVTTRDGRSISGWLASETDAAVALRTAAGAEETVNRSDIATLSATGVSLMPEGLEQAMAKEDVANLVAFLKSDN